MITTLLEISMTKIWMAYGPYFDAIRQTMQTNIAERKHLSVEDVAKKHTFYMTINSSDKMVRMESVGSNTGQSVNANNPHSFVAILPVCGPITRNGGACSYGSIDLRDDMIEAAKQEDCAGVVLYINSGGGSANAIDDIKYAINYVHQQGKKVKAFIDGMCASAAYYYAALCDEIYYMNEKDQIGSIGAFAAFYTQKDGDKNRYTNETFRVVYADKSYEKNKWYREASEGNYETVKEELNELNEDFIADVKAARPNAKDKHLHGAMFNAADLQGTLVDGQSTLEECCAHMIAIYESNTDNSTNTKTSINMQNYPLINAACGMKEGEITVKEEGAFMNAPLLDSLEAHLADTQQKMADAEQKATTAEQSLAEMQGRLDEISAQLTAANNAKADAEKALADAKEAHSKEIENLNAEHTEAIAKKDEQIAQLTEGKTNAETELTGAKEALAAAEQQIADKDAQIAQLTNEPSEEQNAGEAPANNGEGAKVQTLREFDPSGYKTNAERKAAFERYKRGED